MSKNKKEKVIGLDIDNKELEIKVNDLSFRPAVFGILIKDEKILLSKQFNGYDFPGGGINIDETIEEALEREFKEETGLKVKKTDLIACEQAFSYYRYKDKSFNSILIYYLCEKIGGEVSIDGFDENEKKYADYPEWIDIKDIEKIQFCNNVNSVAIIKKAFEMIK